MRRFALRFAGGALVLIVLFELVRGTAGEQRVFAAAILQPAAAVATWFDSAHPTAVSHRRLVSGGTTLNVTRGCEGTEMLSLFAAAVLAFPSSWRRRLAALGTGMLLIYVLSVFRLGALVWVLANDRAAFDAIHGIVAPLVPLAVVGLYFSAWAARTQAVHPS